MGMLKRTERRRGVSFIECLVVIGAIAILLAMGFFAHRHLRQQARVSLAESRLRQVATAFDLHFNKYQTYPPQGANLAEALGEFIDADACLNALASETTKGEAISLLYRQPSLRMLDRPNEYLTAMVSDDGKVAVVLLSGNKVVSEWNLDAQAPDYASVMAEVLARLEPADTGEGGDTTGKPGGIKYICVKGGSGLVYQSTSNRLGGNREGQKDVTDTFVMKVGGKVTLAELKEKTVTLDVHDAQKMTYSLLKADGTQYRYGDLLGEPIELRYGDNLEELSGITVQFTQDAQNDGQLVVQVTMGIHASLEVFHSLTRIWVEFDNLELKVDEAGADGNKYFATRYNDPQAPSWWK